jgi:hypothetical protein
MAMMQEKPKKTKKAVKKYVPTAQEKKNLEDASKNINMRPPFKQGEQAPKSAILPKGSSGSAKNGKSMKKAKNGTSLGMKSVKAGFDKNPGVTRADIIVAAKKKAKSGTKMKKAMMGAMAKPMMKSGGSMKKCKYGCK